MARGANTAGGYYAATPNQESRYRELAEAFTSRGLDPQITTGGFGGIAQGLGGLAQAFTGKILADRADTKRTETVERLQKQIADMGLDPKYAAIASALTEQDPEAGLGFAADVITSPQAESWHTLTKDEAVSAGLDPSGSYEVSSNGNTNVLVQPKQSALLTPEELAQKLQIAQSGASRSSVTINNAKEAREEQKVEAADNVLGAIGDIRTQMGDASLPTTGMGGAMLQAVPGTAAHNVKNLVNTIEANLSFEKLNAMRAASPTGGALGSITERELELLGATVASLKQSQTQEQFEKNLGTVEKQFYEVINGPGTYKGAGGGANAPDPVGIR